MTDVHKREAGLFFTSCFVPNDSILSVTGAKLPGCVIFSDKSKHTSMIEGIRHSNAPELIFAHNHMYNLERKLSLMRQSAPDLVVFESVSSLSRIVVNIRQMCDLAQMY